MGTLHPDQYVFDNIFHSVLLRMRNVPDRVCRENRNTHCIFTFFFENSTVYEKKWASIVETGRPHLT
jgi:hypothetical protein